MIAIVNISKGEDGVQEYEVRINRAPVCRVYHIRAEGLAVLLEKAAAAVKKQRDIDLVLLIDLARKNT